MRMLNMALGAAIAVYLAAPTRAAGTQTNPPNLPHEHSAPAANAVALVDDLDSPTALIGQPAPDWAFDHWIRTQPLSLESLRGKVVLLRWWTNGCHFCAATLPAIERLRRSDAAKGLVTIGVYHPKPPRKVSDRRIVAVANELGFSGPIAVDRYWSTLDRYWLGGHPERSWTSVSFLIDRHGIIRWAHGGGEYHPSDDPQHARCVIQYQELERALEAALAEPAAKATDIRE